MLKEVHHTNPLKKCTYMYPDLDWCELPDGHDGNHTPIAPRCASPHTNLNLHCTDSMWHTGKHQTKLEW